MPAPNAQRAGKRRIPLNLPCCGAFPEAGPLGAWLDMRQEQFSRESLQSELERIADLGGSESFPCAHALLVERIASGQLAEASRPAATGGSGGGSGGQSRETEHTSSADGQHADDAAEDLPDDGEPEDAEHRGAGSGKARLLISIGGKSARTRSCRTESDSLLCADRQLKAPRGEGARAR